MSDTQEGERWTQNSGRRDVENKTEPLSMSERCCGSACGVGCDIVRREKRDCIFLKDDEFPKFVQNPELGLCYQYLARLVTRE